MKANYAAWHIEPADFSTLSPKERLQHILQFAVLAPSAHNTQPWLFHIEPEENKITLQLDSSRLLVSDTQHRFAFMSLGAAAHNCIAAVETYGAKARVSFSRRTAVITINVAWPRSFKSPGSDQLATLSLRSTNRGAFLPKPLTKSQLEAFTFGERPGLTCHRLTGQSIKQRVGELAHTATLAVMDKGFKAELAEWVRPNGTNEYTGMPAGVQEIPGPLTPLASLLVRKMPIQKSQAKKDRAQLTEAPLVLVLCSTDDNPSHWIEAGRLYQQISLRATRLGLDSSSFGSLIEDASSRASLQKLLGTSDLPVAVLRVGKALKKLPRTPRLPAAMVTK